MEQVNKTDDETVSQASEEILDEANATDVVDESPEEDSPQGDASGRMHGKLEEAYGKRDELQNKYLRAVAELDNLRKRSVRDREEIASRTRANIIGDLLPAVDAFRLGLQDAQNREEAKSVVEGFAMVMTQMESILGEHGLSLVDATGQPFDTSLHEAVSHEASEEIEEGHVISTVRTGYKLGDRLLRPAAVVISKGSTGEEEKSEDRNS
jgi:molecular chaperone GrpE